MRTIMWRYTEEHDIEGVVASHNPTLWTGRSVPGKYFSTIVYWRCPWLRPWLHDWDEYRER